MLVCGSASHCWIVSGANCTKATGKLLSEGGGVALAKRGGLRCLPQASGEKFFIRIEGGILVPLLTSAASAPWRPFHGGGGNAPHKDCDGAHHHGCGTCNTGPGGSGSPSVTHQCCVAFPGSVSFFFLSPSVCAKGGVGDGPLCRPV